MPGFQIHLAIANRYMQKHKIENKEEFLEGNIVPDFEEKSKSHYTIKAENHNLIEFLNNRVSVDSFLKENEVENDLKRGILLHLIADNLFFTQFFPKDYLENVGYDQFGKDLYGSYDQTNSYIEKKYNIKFPERLKERMIRNIEDARKLKKLDIEKGKNILPLEKLDEFIERVSDIDLEEYIEKHKLNLTQTNKM